MTITSERRPAPGIRMIVFAVAGVGWAFLAMAGAAALGLHLLGADAAGELGPMTAAVTVLAVGGSVAPSGALEAFGIRGADAHTAIELMPLGVSLVGALVLGWTFARSLRAAGPAVGGGELALRAGAVAAVFLLLLGGLAWAGSSTLTFQGGGLGLGDAARNGPKLEIPGVGDIGDLGGIGGGLADRLADLARAKADVGFSVRTGPSLLGGAVWVAAVLLIAVLAARRAPLPRGAGALHRTVRPAASALCAVLVLTVAAGWAAALVAAAGDDHPRRVLGGALLGAPNGVWLGLPLGLFVPWHGRATGSLTKVLPDPLDDLLAGGADRPVSVARLAEYDGRVWLLPVACATAMLLAGVLTAVRTPRGARGAVAYAGRCGFALGAVTAVALPLLALATRVTADAGLSVLGVDAMGAGLDLRGNVILAVVLGAAWGLTAGVVGGLLACATGAAGRGASAYARREEAAKGTGGRGGEGREKREKGDAGEDGRRGWGTDAGWTPEPAGSGAGSGPGASGYGRGPGDGFGGVPGDVPGPHRPSPGYRPARDETNPYLRPRPDARAGGEPGAPAGQGSGPEQRPGPKQRPGPGVDPSSTTAPGTPPSGPSSGPSSGSSSGARPGGGRGPRAGQGPERPRRPYGSPPPPPPPPPPAPRGWPGPDGRPPRR
ncbi:streptophobe family protein [Streptomyces sp. URMC 126]|uniref:streptophobe family protein n=1 Tax=Streptomyces sp. URMC 126 TaxID=3423401 RepID=UPI003F1C0835